VIDYYWSDAYLTDDQYYLKDIAPVGTSGYGPDNGDYRILTGTPSPNLRSISQQIGRVINLRRNANNVPQAVIAASAGDIVSISQPIGKIINLRRNSSNVPGD
jgi:hypothetical protein